MTKVQIQQALIDSINDFPVGPAAPLSEQQQTDLTDQLAGVLETVNPTNNYPPTPK